MTTALTQTSLSLPKRQGKVRDIYDLGDWVLLVSTDRISAFDWVLSTGIPDKGRVLNELSGFWFDFLPEAKPNHLRGQDGEIVHHASLTQTDLDDLVGRYVLARKCKVVPIECVVRGYLIGSGWKDYQKTGKVCGIKLPAGLRQADKLPEPIFTPATKEESGHDINISFEEMVARVGRDLSEELRRRSLAIYQTGADYARERGIIIADTKFEFGEVNGENLLIDEVLTPDSSRFWPVDQYVPGSSPPSFDKQFVRDWLETTDWDKNSPPPPLPDDIVQQTREKYVQAYEGLTGKGFPWK